MQQTQHGCIRVTYACGQSSTLQKEWQMGTAQLFTPRFFMVSFDLVREMLYIYLNYVTTLTSIR